MSVPKAWTGSGEAFQTFGVRMTGLISPVGTTNPPFHSAAVVVTCEPVGNRAATVQVSVMVW